MHQSDGKKNRQRIEGWISDHWDQGMEYVAAIFQDGSQAHSREGGWRYEGTYELGDGDELTIFSDEGAVLWSGKIACGGRLEIAPDSFAWAPQDVELAQWRAWFRASPPLRAVLVRDLDACMPMS